MTLHRGTHGFSSMGIAVDDNGHVYVSDRRVHPHRSSSTVGMTYVRRTLTGRITALVPLPKGRFWVEEPDAAQRSDLRRVDSLWLDGHCVPGARMPLALRESPLFNAAAPVDAEWARFARIERQLSTHASLAFADAVVHATEAGNVVHTAALAVIARLHAGPGQSVEGI